MRADAAAGRARAIELAASGRTPAEIATMLGRSPRSVRRYLAGARDEVQQLRAERLAALTGLALADAAEALATLRETMRDPETPPAVRVRAAATVLEHTLRFWQASDVEARLQRLEEALRERTTHIP